MHLSCGFFQLQFSTLGYIAYVQTPPSTIQARQLFWAAGLEVLAALTEQGEQSLLWQENDREVGESQLLQKTSLWAAIEQHDPSRSLAHLLPSSPRDEYLQAHVFIGNIFWTWGFSGAAGRLHWLRLFWNTRGWGGTAGLPEHTAVMATTDFTGIPQNKSFQ